MRAIVFNRNMWSISLKTFSLHKSFSNLGVVVWTYSAVVLVIAWLSFWCTHFHPMMLFLSCLLFKKSHCYPALLSFHYLLMGIQWWRTDSVWMVEWYLHPLSVMWLNWWPITTHEGGICDFHAVLKDLNHILTLTHNKHQLSCLHTWHLLRLEAYLLYCAGTQKILLPSYIYPRYDVNLGCRFWISIWYHQVSPEGSSTIWNTHW